MATLEEKEMGMIINLNNKRNKDTRAAHKRQDNRMNAIEIKVAGTGYSRHFTLIFSPRLL
ncbi:MAG: hypothetical protein LBU53_11595 [Zoogloeaceae bacterium]|jgi:hypothetical protein|nr:hypothetical protein [Zoogloeaceae bacterium]